MEAADEQQEPDPADGDLLFGTETMAELCVRQGRIRNAVAIYEQLLRQPVRQPPDGPADDQRRARWAGRLKNLAGAKGADPPAAIPSTQPPAIGAGRVPTTSREPVARLVGLDAARPSGAPHRLPMVIREPVRSGQIVYAEKNDLIVLGPVNPGAQLIADGNIHIYSRLSGRAVAGAHGATDARIYCQRLEAELVGIDAAYLAADDIPAERRGMPAQVFLQAGRCVIVPL